MNWASAFFGLLIVAVGTLLLFDNLDVLDAGEVLSQWWPLALIVGGILTFAANPRHWIVPLVLVVGGAVVLPRTTGVVDSIGVLLPIALIAVGLLVIFGNGIGSSVRSSDSTLNSFNIFSGSSLSSDSKQFQGGRIGAVFGGAEVDLRHAALAPGAAFDVFAFGGGRDLRPAGMEGRHQRPADLRWSRERHHQRRPRPRRAPSSYRRHRPVRGSRSQALTQRIG